jgi:hypothetical protein
VGTWAAPGQLIRGLWAWAGMAICGSIYDWVVVQWASCSVHYTPTR